MHRSTETFQYPPVLSFDSHHSSRYVYSITDIYMYSDTEFYLFDLILP